LTQALEMRDDGTSHTVDLTQESLQPDKVYCIVDAQSKSIYIWQGRNAGVRKRFVGAHTASRLRAEQGLHYKVQAVDQGNEPPSLLELL